MSHYVQIYPPAVYFDLDRSHPHILYNNELFAQATLLDPQFKKWAFLMLRGSKMGLVVY